ncbi:hypothetical protein Dfri01_29030 [Dyadobacter frigoris]|nr:hypothetical protein Dfri01_29030 [Dyadobacter frigoris]
MHIAREEIFGAVVVMIPYKDEADAIRISNDSHYGLAGSVLTENRGHGLEIARQIRTGRMSINDNFGNFDCPFGGYKQSGIGREFGSFGICEYVEQKAIFV